MKNDPDARLTGTEFERIEPGVWYKRPVCWLLGHEWRSAGEEDTCVRCGDGTLDEPVEIETGREVWVTEHERAE